MKDNLQHNFKALKLGIYPFTTTSTCGQLQITFQNGVIPVLRIYLDRKQNPKIESLIIDQDNNEYLFKESLLLLCNDWLKFWFLFENSFFKIGLGTIYNEKILGNFPIKAPNKITSITFKSLLLNYGITIDDEGLFIESFIFTFIF